MKTETVNFLTDDDMQGIKDHIMSSEEAGPETKAICVKLLDASQNLTKPVRAVAKATKDVMYGTHDMVSMNGKTLLNKFFEQRGTNFRFWHLGSSNGKNWNIFLSPVMYDTKAKLIK